MGIKKIRTILRKLNGSNVVDLARKDIEDLKNNLADIDRETKKLQYVLDTQSHEQLTREIEAKVQSGLAFDGLNKQVMGLYFDSIFSRDKTKRSIFFLGTHEWGNLGDLAISYSQVAFLEKLFPDAKVFNVSRISLLANWDRFRTSITANDIIVLPGGGNTGDIWVREEYARRAVIQAFPDNYIIGFPQSVKFFDDNEAAVSGDIYNAHRKLLLMYRDDNSYNFAKQYFSQAKLLRTEDIVFTYKFATSDFGPWDRILFVARNDKEKRADSGIEALKESVIDNFPTSDTDTVVPDVEFVSLENGAQLVYKKVDEIHASRLVVTDRLHGAIFALQAGRPVIVFDNNYGKIRGALKNITKLLPGRILFIEDGEDVSIETIQQMYELDESKDRPSELFSKEFDSLGDEIQQFIKKS